MIKENDYIKKQLNKPWEVSKDGDNSFDCYGLVKHCYNKLLNIKLPDYAYDVFDVSNLLKTIDYQKKQPCFYKIVKKDRKSFDIVLMGRNQKPTHVGVYLAKGILHCTKDAGVIYTPLNNLKTQYYNYLYFYRYAVPYTYRHSCRQ